MPPTVPLLRKQLVAVVDKATTMVCLDAAGQIREVDLPFDTMAGSYQAPPFHRWCRSVVAPYLDGFVVAHRVEANEEISRRPLKERRKGPGGETGARIPPPPHEATHERRGTPGGADYSEVFSRLLAPPDDAALAALARYLDDPTEIDRQLRTGTLDDVTLDLVAELDSTIAAGTLTEDVTVFTALRPEIWDSVEVSDVLSDDSYLIASLDPRVARRHGRPVALTLLAGQHAAPLDTQTQQLILPRRHSWQVIALGLIIVGLLL